MTAVSYNEREACSEAYNDVHISQEQARILKKKLVGAGPFLGINKKRLVNPGKAFKVIMDAGMAESEESACNFLCDGINGKEIPLGKPGHYMRIDVVKKIDDDYDIRFGVCVHKGFVQDDGRDFFLGPTSEYRRFGLFGKRYVKDM